MRLYINGVISFSRHSKNSLRLPSRTCNILQRNEHIRKSASGAVRPESMHLMFR